MNNIFATLGLLFILHTNIRAQSGFERVYGNSEPDIFRTVISTSDGGIIAGGGTNSYYANNISYSDVYIVKMNSQGDTLWTHHFGDSLYQIILSIAENAEGYVATGWYAVDSPAIAYDGYAIQYDQNGNKLWEKFYGGNGANLSNDVLIDNNGRIVLGGGTTSNTYGGYDMYAAKLDVNGNQIAEAHFGGTDHDYANAIIQTADGGYALAGHTHTLATGYNIYVVKTDSNFIFQWAHDYPAPFDDFGNDIAEDASGNLWILGTMELYPDTSGMVLIKTDPDGTNPVMFFPVSHNGDFGYHIQALNGGGFLIAGVTGNLEKGSEMLLEKLDVNGDTLWTRHFGGTKWEAGFAVAVDPAENILLAGQTEGFGVEQYDAYLVKMDSNGNIPCPASVSFVSSPDSICEDENAFFTNTTVSSQPFTWSENGNNFSNNVDAAYYFNSAGSYDITLSACNISSSQNITVNPKPPTHFTYPHSGTDVNFTLDAGINVQSITWNFGDGSPLNVTDINPFHHYSNFGAYWVVLTVTNDQGCDSTYIEQIDLLTGIDEVKGNSFNLFPNPAHESTILRTSSGNILPLTIVMMNVEGSVIKEFILTKAQEQISVGDMVPGIYLLKLQDSSGFTSALKLEVY
ncbi:MAG TPA: PKD domain-containing protein [Chitinophagales bacterium]|nr:PKD domain-containing protein [Chitinophagales bacterium]